MQSTTRFVLARVVAATRLRAAPRSCSRLAFSSSHRLAATATLSAATSQVASPLLASPNNWLHRQFHHRAGSRKEHNQDSKAVVDANVDVNKLAFIGGGNMAEAIITGLLEDNLIPKEKLIVSDPNPEMRKKYTEKGIPASDRNIEAIHDADVVVLAVKPQVLEKVLEDIAPELRPKTLVISVVAGSTIKVIQSKVDTHGKDIRIVRSMPNTPAMIGEGVTAWTQSARVSEKQHNLTKHILGAFGLEVFVDHEDALDMATALSGSGPAYFFLVAEAMIDAGVHMGFPRPVATRLVQQTMLGSALYMQSSKLHPAVLRNNITSPGGTTAAALYRAEKNGFRAVIADAIWAAYERCTELGSQVPIRRIRPRE